MCLSSTSVTWANGSNWPICLGIDNTGVLPGFGCFRWKQRDNQFETKKSHHQLLFVEHQSRIWGMGPRGDSLDLLFFRVTVGNIRISGDPLAFAVSSDSRCVFSAAKRYNRSNWQEPTRAVARVWTVGSVGCIRLRLVKHAHGDLNLLTFMWHTALTRQLRSAFWSSEPPPLPLPTSHTGPAYRFLGDENEQVA